MQHDLFIALPPVLLNRVHLACLQLAFLNVLVPAERVYVLALDGNSGEERLFLKHGTLIYYILILILEAVVAHTSKQEPCAYVFVMSSNR
jgi:hypothetical protein